MMIFCFACFGQNSLFCTAAREYRHELDDILVQDANELLNLDVRDGSIGQVSEALVKLYTFCSQEKFEEARKLYREYDWTSFWLSSFSLSPSRSCS